MHVAAMPLTMSSGAAINDCPPTHSPSELALSTALLVGIVLSYVPQQLAILLGKSSEGLSPWFLLLGSVATISTVANVLLLQWHVVQCCAVWSPLGCFENALGVIQLASQALMFLAIGVLYLVYFPKHLKFASPASPLDQDFDNEIAPLLPSPERSAERTITARLWTLSRRISLAVLVYLLATITLVSLALALTKPPSSPSPPPDASAPPTFGSPAPELVALAGIYGGIATIMSCLQFLPQIIHTYDAKDPGALSIGTMLMQTPGTLLLIYSLSLRPGTNVSTYLSYCVSATCQGTLLVLSLVYLHRKWQLARHGGATTGPAGGAGREYRYGELVVTDEEAPAADDVTSPLFATLRSSPNLAAASLGDPALFPAAPTTTTAVDTIDDDESLIEDPPTIHLLPSHSLLPTAPPTITSSTTGGGAELMHPSSSLAHHALHPSPPHSPLGSMIAVKSLRFAPGASGSVKGGATGTRGADSRSIDTLGSIGSSSFGGGHVGSSSVSATTAASRAGPGGEVPTAPKHLAEGAPAEMDGGDNKAVETHLEPVASTEPATLATQPSPAAGVTDPQTRAFASAIHSHFSSLVAAPATPRFEMDDAVALDAALTAALPPSDLDLDQDGQGGEAEGVLARAISSALPPSMDSLAEPAEPEGHGRGRVPERSSASTRSLLNEPMGDSNDVGPDAVRDVLVPSVETVARSGPSGKTGGGSQIELEKQVEGEQLDARSASPTVAAEGDGSLRSDEQLDEEDPASDMSVTKDADRLHVQGDTSLVSVGASTTGSSSTAGSAQRQGGKRKGGGAGKKRKGGAGKGGKGGKKW